MVTLYQEYSSHPDSSKNMAARGRGLFYLYIYIENFKKKSCQKLLDQFQYNMAEIILWWPSTKIFQAIMIRQKNMAARGWDLFSLSVYIEKKKKF